MTCKQYNSVFLVFLLDFVVCVAHYSERVYSLCSWRIVRCCVSVIYYLCMFGVLIIGVVLNQD